MNGFFMGESERLRPGKSNEVSAAMRIDAFVQACPEVVGLQYNLLVPKSMRHRMGLDA